MSHRRKAEEGFAFLTALVVLLLVSIALSLVATSLRLEMRVLQSEVTRIKLTALSDAALAETLARLDGSPSFTGLPPQELDGGVIASEVKRLSTRSYRIVASSSYRGRRREVVARAQRRDTTLEVSSWRRVPGRSLSGGS